jgi:hypothetical protein
MARRCPQAAVGPEQRWRHEVGEDEPPVLAADSEAALEEIDVIGKLGRFACHRQWRSSLGTAPVSAARACAGAVSAALGPLGPAHPGRRGPSA